MKLKSELQAKEPYSATERRVFDALPKGKSAMTTSALLDKIHGGRPEGHARNILNSVIRSLIRKMNRNEEPFRIEKSKRRGPHPITIRVVNGKDS